MQQNINYQGMQTQPSDHDTPDGPMHLALNLEHRSGAYHAARIPTKEEFYIENFTPLFIHNPSSDNTSDNIVIGAYYNDTDGSDWDYKLEAYYYTKQSNENKKITINNNTIGTNDGPSDFDNFCNIGNIVCFTCRNQYRILTFDGSTYKLREQAISNIDAKYSVIRVCVRDPSNTDQNNSFNSIHTYPNKRTNKIASEVFESTFNYKSLNDFKDKTLSEVENIMREESKTKIDEAFGKINSTVEALKKQGIMIFPVLACYAYRLYDGSNICASAPTLLIPLSQAPIFDTNTNKGAFYYEAYHFGIEFGNNENFISEWKDLITHIDVFVSAPIYSIDMSGETHIVSTYGINNNEYISLQLKYKDVYKELKNVSAFYKVGSIEIENINKRKFSPFDINNPITDYLSNETLKQESVTIRAYDAKKITAFNNRIILSNIKAKELIFDRIAQQKVEYYNFKYLLPFYDTGDTRFSELWTEGNGTKDENFGKTNNINTDYYYVKYKIGKEIKYFRVKNESKSITISDALFWSDSRAVAILWPYTGETYDDVETPKYNIIKLTPNDFLNFSYTPNLYSDGTNENVVQTDILSISPSLIKASEVNNPFVFKDGNSAECGTGEIITIASNARAVSQGQFGQYPIFAFCTDGIYAVGVGTDGTLQSCNPFTYDIITSPLSVCNIQTSLAYITRSGIHIIGNDGPQEILTFNQEDNYNFDNERQQTFIGKHYANLPTLVSPYTYFTQGAHLTYDYPNQRIIAYNPQHTYSYIYSIPDQTWSIILQSYDNNLNTFSQSLLIKENKIYNLSSQTIQDKLNGLLITRPIKLNSPDVHKTIQAIIQRGNFPSGTIAQALYASNDAINWFPIWSSQTERLRPIRGTAYKYYRLVIFLTDFQQDYSLSGCTIDYLPKLTNKIR